MILPLTVSQKLVSDLGMLRDKNRQQSFKASDDVSIINFSRERWFPLKGLRQQGRYGLQPCLLWPLDGSASIDFQRAFADRVVTARFANEAGFVFLFLSVSSITSDYWCPSLFFWPPGVSSVLPALQRLHGFAGGDNTMGNGI